MKSNVHRSSAIAIIAKPSSRESRQPVRMKKSTRSTIADSATSEIRAIGSTPTGREKGQLNRPKDLLTVTVLAKITLHNHHINPGCLIRPQLAGSDSPADTSLAQNQRATVMSGGLSYGRRAPDQRCTS
jgi:hypothetical protein